MSDDRLKLILGHCIGAVVVMGLLFVIIRIALGNVQEVSSYGLMPLVVGLSNLAILYGNWAWQTRPNARPNGDSENGAADLSAAPPDSRGR